MEDVLIPGYVIDNLLDSKTTLSAQSIKVAIYLIREVGVEGIMPSKIEMAKSLNITTRNITKCLCSLINWKVLTIDGQDNYRLSGQYRFNKAKKKETRSNSSTNISFMCKLAL